MALLAKLQVGVEQEVRGKIRMQRWMKQKATSAELRKILRRRLEKEAVAEPEASREDFQESRRRPREVETEESQLDIEDLVNK